MDRKRFVAAIVAIISISSLITATVEGSASEPKNFCQGCRSLVSYVVAINSSAEVRAEYKGLVNNFCELYYPVSTDFQQGPCPLFTESLFYVVDKMDPIHHCDQIGACGQSDADGSQMLPTATAAALNNELQIIQDRNGGVVCNVCEQIIEQLKEQLNDKRFVRELHDRVDAFCDYLRPIKQDKECARVLTAHLDGAIDFVAHLEPLKYCRSIQLCSAAQLIEASDRKKLPAAQQLPSLADFNDFGLETSVEIGNKQIRGPKKGPNCRFCKLIVKELFKFIKNNKTEENIRHALDNICAQIYKEGQSRQHCDDLVAVYSKELVEMLADETDPEMVCMMLDQCTYQKPAIVAEKRQQQQGRRNVTMGTLIPMLDSSIQVGSLRVCVECKLFINYLQSVFEDPKSEEEIKSWLLDELCDSIQEKDVKDSCVELVDKYSLDFFEAVAKELDPKAVCIQMQACRPRKVSFYSISQQKAPIGPSQSMLVSKLTTTTNRPLMKSTTTTGKPQDNGKVCDKCVAVITNIDEYLSAHSVDHDVSVLIDKVCNKIQDDEVKSDCISIVKLFGQYIIQAISTMDNPRQLCSRIALC